MLNIVNANGKLIKEYLPSICFDSSVLIDYWIAEYIWNILKNEMLNEFQRLQTPEFDLIRELFLKNKRIHDTFEIRCKIISGKANLTPVITSLSLIELMEWHVDANFKEFASSSLVTMSIQ